MATSIQQDKELQESINQLVDRAKGYGYPLTTAKAAEQIMDLIQARDKELERKARIDELQSLNRDVFGDNKTAKEIKKEISRHIGILFLQEKSNARNK